MRPEQESRIGAKSITTSVQPAVPSRESSTDVSNLAWPVLFNLEAGWPAPETFPTSSLARLANETISDPTVLGYMTVHAATDGQPTVYAGPGFQPRAELLLGDANLRQELTAWVSRRQGADGLRPGSFCLTSGSTQAIALAANAYLRPGTAALVEELTFPLATQFFRMRGAAVRTVPLDGEGLDVQALERQLHKLTRDGVRPTLLYTIPTLHLPTATVQSPARRRRILELANEWDLVVLEDAVYADLLFDGRTGPPSLLTMDDSRRVLQVNSFSKILAPGLRLGWICGPEERIADVSRSRQDLGVSQWISRIVAAYMASGELEQHVESLGPFYCRKRDIAAQALRASAGSLVHFDLPPGGFYLWVRLSPEIDWPAAEERALRLGVTVREATMFGAAAASPTCLRIGFAHLPDAALVLGISLLGEALRAGIES